jgi:phage regulator Rha-like protein
MNDQPHNPFPAMFEGQPLLTMSSLEISELTGKRHDNVTRDIRTMLEALDENTGLSFEGSYQDSTGRSLRCYNLPKRETIILISGYDVVMRSRIIDRWMELEEASRPDPMKMLDDPSVLRHLLLENTTKRIEAEKRADTFEAKAIAHDRIADAHGTFCRGTAAKMIGVPPYTLNRWLRTNGWTFRRVGDRDDLAYQSKIAAGCLEHKVTTGQRPDGTEWTSTQVRVTAKGLTVLAKAFPRAAEAA